MMDLGTEENEYTDDAESRSGRFWLVCCAAVTALAAFLRFYRLDLKPFHHDEGVNGYFLTTLFRDGIYHYDPANYHGPTLYYIALAFSKLFGLTTVSVRSSVAIFGVLLVVLTFFLHRYIGRAGSLFAGLFIALSPGMVFISRYFIHEILFVFLGLAAVVSIVFFIEKRKAGKIAILWSSVILLVCFLPSTLSLASMIAGESVTALWALRAVFFAIEAGLVFFVMRMLLAWNEGRPIYFLLAAASVALMFATKETTFITLGTMAIACVCVWIWRRVYGAAGDAAAQEGEIDDRYLNWRNFRAALGNGTDLVLILTAAAAVLVYIIVLFFSSFFTYPDGVQGFINAYAIWSKTGSKDHTQNGTWAYLSWGMRIESPIFVLSAIGAAIAMIKGRHRFAMFAGLWAFGLLAAYTLIPYKTPWLALSFLLPMCIAAGYGLNEIGRVKGFGKAAAVSIGVVAAAVLAYQSYDLNAVHYDDNETTYVYAHTQREFLDMVRRIEHYAEKSGKGTDTEIQIVSPDYWPLVWYVKDYPKAYFSGKLVDAGDADIIIAKRYDQDAEVIRRYSANYVFDETYALRPGVDLMLLVRKDIADPDAKPLYTIQMQ